MDIARQLADRLKSLRQHYGWSLSEAASRTGVSKAMLGQIERQESSPTVATLWKLATGFNVPFTELLMPDLDGESQPQATMVATPLFPYDPQLNLDYLALRLEPGATSQSEPHQHGVIEHVVVVSGLLCLATPDGKWELRAGEGWRFAGDVTHSYHNPGAVPVLFHSLIHYPPSAGEK